MSQKLYPTPSRNTGWAAWLASLLVGLALAGCLPEISCDDPLGCLVRERGEPLTVGILAPLSDPDACPPAAAEVAAIQQVLETPAFPGHAFRVVTENSQFDPLTAHDRLTRLVEEGATAGLFYLDCAGQTTPAVRAGPDGGIATFTDLAPAGEISAVGVFAWLPSLDEQAAAARTALASLTGAGLWVLTPPSPRATGLAEALCLDAQPGECTISQLTAPEVEIPALLQSAFAENDVWLLLLPPSPDLLSLLQPLTFEKSIVFFDPFGRRLSEGLPLDGFYLLAYPDPATDDIFLEADLARRSAQQFVAALQAASLVQGDTLIIPRQALMDALAQPVASSGIFSSACQPDGACLHPTLSLYPFRDGDRIIGD